MSQYFPRPCERFGGDIDRKKSRLKNATAINTSKLAAKYDLVSLKAEIDKLGIVKLVPVPFDWSKLSNVVKNNVAKKAM